MKSFASKLTVAIIFLSYGSAVLADFDLYGGFINYADGTQARSFYADMWQIFDHDPDCNDISNFRWFFDTDDVSGNKIGVRCEGDNCSGNGDPNKIDVVEMHFANDPLFHFTIYKNRNHYEMIGTDNRGYGQCDPYGANNYFCFPGSTMSGNRKFRCYTQFTAAQINRATQLALTFNEFTAKYNITGYELARENESEV
ncbi:hypothetical protein B0H63DRAFT_447608 [Podospora didyma]|uniref:Ecp2 effector protein domain-containing protein n=1 Tax=Podospora didyma TaxID=330526 RepID=A0AAE0U0U1_9PEZI|nr:hypothetical protein B0H63DRAFT_447608 [Podospora didyma]